MTDVVITGIGVVSAIGAGQTAFAEALFAGRHAFGFLTREGRCVAGARFLGAELHQAPDAAPRPQIQRNTVFSARTEIIKIKAKFLHELKINSPGKCRHHLLRKDDSVGGGRATVPPYPYCSQTLY